MKRFLSATIAAVMTLTLLTACGNSGQTTSPNDDNGDESEVGNDGTTEADATVEPGTKGTLEFWTMFTGADGSSMQAIVDAYNATDPDYTVNHRAIEANDLYLNMPLAIQSKVDVPDVAMSHIERIPIFVEHGFLEDLTPYLSEAGISADNYNPAGWEMTDLNGAHYGVPLDIHSYVGYVNMDLYDDLGLTHLDDGVVTWDEIREAGDLIKENGMDVIPVGMAWLRVKFLASYAQLGGTLSTDGETPDFNNELAVRVLEEWVDLYENDYTQKEGDDSWAMFLGGNVLYCPEGQWMYNNVAESGLNVRMFDYPVYDSNIKGNWSSSHQFVLPVSEDRDAEKTMAVMAFIDYVGNNGLEWAKAGQTPAHVSIVQIEEFEDMPQAFLAEQSEELKIYDYKYYGHAVESLDKVLGDIFFGRLDPQEGLDQAVQETADRISTEG